MKDTTKNILIAALCSFVVFTSFFCEARTTLEKLVDKFTRLTKVQQRAFEQKYYGEKIYGRGRVSEVEESGSVDDVPGFYYKVVTEPQNTAEGNTYRMIFCYDELEQVEKINKGRQMRRTGTLLKISEGDYWISVWIKPEY